MKAYVDHFIQHLKVDEKKSQNTLAAYTTDLLQFSTYVGSMPVRQLTEAVCQRYTSWLRRHRPAYSHATIARKVTVVRRFLKYLYDFGVLSRGLVDSIPVVKVKRKAPNPLTSMEMGGLLTWLDTNSCDPLEKRDQAIVELALASGLTGPELAALDIDEIRTSDLIWLHDSRPRPRVIQISERAATAVRLYLKHHRADLVKDSQEPALFINTQGERLTRSVLGQVVRDRAQQAGVERVVSPQVLRHTAATTLYRAGLGLKEVQRILGLSKSYSTVLFTYYAAD